MNKNRIRLTESQLHRVIKESVKNVLNEEQFVFNSGNLEDLNSIYVAMQHDWDDEWMGQQISRYPGLKQRLLKAFNDYIREVGNQIGAVEGHDF